MRDVDFTTSGAKSVVDQIQIVAKIGKSDGGSSTPTGLITNRIESDKDGILSGKALVVGGVC